MGPCALVQLLNSASCRSILLDDRVDLSPNLQWDMRNNEVAPLVVDAPTAELSNCTSAQGPIMEIRNNKRGRQATNNLPRFQDPPLVANVASCVRE